MGVLVSLIEAFKEDKWTTGLSRTKSQTDRTTDADCTTGLNIASFADIGGQRQQKLGAFVTDGLLVAAADTRSMHGCMQ